MVLKKINKIDKPLTRLTKGKKKRTFKLVKWGKKGYYHWLYIKRILSEFYEQMYANKLDKQDKMANFLERHKLLKLTQEYKSEETYDSEENE